MQLVFIESSDSVCSNFRFDPDWSARGVAVVVFAPPTSSDVTPLLSSDDVIMAEVTGGRGKRGAV